MKRSDAVELSARLERSLSVRFTSDVFAPDNGLLDELLRPAPLVVTTPSVERHFGAAMRRWFAARRPGARFLTLRCREANKNMELVLRVCREAGAHGLARRGQIVAVGGGVCTDVCGFAASMFRRGVAHLKIPTTLVGLIDAGIGIKNGVNLEQHKNALGAFSPPEAAVLDPRFLRTLDRRNLGCGLAEAVKIAVVRDEALFELLEAHGAALAASHFVEPAAAAAELVERAVRAMLAELAANPYEMNGYERAVDFGHTFSPCLEARSHYELPHGEAVALDMALSAALAERLGILGAGDAERILDLLAALGLDLWTAGADAEALWDALDGVAAHRDGALNLVLPTRIGACVFVKERAAFGLDGLRAALEYLERRNAQSRRRTVGA